LEKQMTKMLGVGVGGGGGGGVLAMSQVSAKARLEKLNYK